MTILFAVGGRWDKRRKCWAPGAPSSALQCKLHPGQIEAALWFRDWFTAYLSGDDDDEALSIFAALLMGGTRSGKTYLGLHLAIAFMVAVPKARVWFVQEVEVERADELEAELSEILPAAWFTKGKRGASYNCINGAVGRIRSAKYPSKLKRGRCDFAFLNEGQNVKPEAHRRLRERTSDTGGIVVTAANPANKNVDGVWVDDMYQQCKAGRRPHQRAFHFWYKDNPHVKQASIDALETEMSPREFEIEVKGIPKPPIDAVFHAFDYLGNVKPRPETRDVTAEFCYSIGLGKDATDVIGLDFQRSPHMAGVIRRLYENPDDSKLPFFPCIGEIIVELGDEEDLSAAMYQAGLDPATTVIIGDASGRYQTGDHTPRHNSFDILRDCGWLRIHPPDRDELRNPNVVERMKNDNRLFTNKRGDHIVTIDQDICPILVASVKTWRNGATGTPKRWADEAHICDGMSYANWRVLPRKRQSPKIGYRSVKRRRRRAQLRGM